MPPPALSISVIIPARNASATLSRCLTACLAQTRPPVEIIVVDDGSTDATPAVVKRFPVTYIAQSPAGPAAARNRGARAASGNVLAYTDADCVPAPDWLEQLAGHLGDPGAGAVGGSYDMANPASWLARMIHAEILARHTQLHGAPDFLGSFNVAYAKAAFETVGGFDESFRMASAEDNDLSYRLQDAGFRLIFTPEARVAHYHPERLVRYLRTQYRHGYWRVKLYHKHANRLRTGGDRYAGRLDLLAPPLALAAAGWACVAACGILTGAGWFARPALILLAVMALAVVLMHAPLAARMPVREGWRFPLVAALRDVARAAGMARGFLKGMLGNRSGW